MEAYRELFHEQLTEKPMKMLQKTYEGYDTEKGWVFVTNDFITFKSVRTYQTLFTISQYYKYFTPNTFYRNDQRNSGTLRWLNAFVIDVDCKNGHNDGLTLPDLLERINAAGLPLPSMIIETPSGGFHVYFYMQSPKRALPKVINLYEMILSGIAEEIGGDLQAIGAERWFRVPSETNILFRSESRVSFSDMCDWLSIKRETDLTENKRISVGHGNLLNHPAIQRLLEGVSKGQRDNTCYTLALTFKALGMSKDEAEERLYDWNQKNDPPLRQLQIKQKVRSAYKAGAPEGPSAMWIRQLSGIAFSYRPFEGAKSRDQRKYSHLEEWKNDILAFLKKQKGSITGSQRKIADAIAIPYSTFKEVVQSLIEEQRITKEVEGKGRAAQTTLKLTNIVPLKPKKKGLVFNGPNSNTLRDKVVGGLSTARIPIVLTNRGATMILGLSGFNSS